MDTLKTKGYVMNVFPWNDRDRLLHLLTPGLGLITANARGSSGIKSKLRSLTQLFSLCDYTLIEKQGRYTVRSGEMIEPFAHIAFDLDRVTAASHTAEVFSDVARNSEPQRLIFELLGYVLYDIDISSDPVFSARLGTFRLMCDIGFSPCLDGCVRCHHKLGKPPYCFSYHAGGMLCGRPECCHPDDGVITLSKSAASLLTYVSLAPYNRLFLFHASETVRTEVSDFTDRWLQEKMEKSYSRLSLLDHTPFRGVSRADLSRQ